MYEGATGILNLGDPASLVATASVCSHVNRGTLILFSPLSNEVTDEYSHGGNTRGARRAIEQQAEVFRASQIVDLPHHDGSTNDMLPAVHSLFAAVNLAAAHDIDTLVWPLQCDCDLDTISRATEITILVSQLAELAGAAAPSIQTPMVELTNQQMIELGVNLGAPWEASWSCDLPVDAHCGACDGCRRRRRMFAVAGVDDPIFNPQPAAG